LPAVKPAFMALNYIGKIGLTVTLFLIGTGLNKKTLQQVGLRPLLQGLALWGMVSASTFALIRCGWIHI
jgi:uncharacterized membrane protein YadS